MHIAVSSPADLVLLDRHAPLIAKLTELYTVMDQQYQRAADHYGFVCTGCDDNCCYTQFFHHTIIEYGFLRNGYNVLDPVRQGEIQHRAIQYCRTIQQVGTPSSSQRPMCPLNENSRCILYAHRPMICRLHGLPHEFRKPGSAAVQGSGCHLFEAQFGAHDYVTFDRTPLYRRMAMLEMELRQALQLKAKIKMTVAEMLCTF